MSAQWDNAGNSDPQQDRNDAGADDEPGETFFERLTGLTEMLPEPARNFVETFGSRLYKGLKTTYEFSCMAVWCLFTSAIVLVVPIVFEHERQAMNKRCPKELKF